MGEDEKRGPGQEVLAHSDLTTKTTSTQFYQVSFLYWPPFKFAFVRQSTNCVRPRETLGELIPWPLTRHMVQIYRGKYNV